MRFILFFILTIGTLFCSKDVFAQEYLIPRPQEIQIGENCYFSISSTWRFSSSELLEITHDIDFLKEQLKARFDITLQSSNTKKVELSIGRFVSGSEHANHEGYYELQIHNEGISITYGTPSGLFYSIQTLLQLIEINKAHGKIPCQTIKDYPKYSYRGLHLDVSRHFFTVEEVKKYLDYMALYKLNKFHWHLTDDQGWRIEIKSHPKLTEIGAYREIKADQEYPSDRIVDGKYGGYYTQKDIKDVLAYAAKLHIDVVPEIELPGHAQAALAAYPELSCTGGPFEVWTDWGVSDNIYCPKEETFAFLEEVLDEVIALFPYGYIHIGGDEAPKKRWKACEHCQELIRQEGLKDEHELQSYFIKRIEKYVNSKGKQIIGWDEILEGGLAPNATVMSWRGENGAIHAAKNGNDAIMTPVGYMYFDYYQGNSETEPLAFNAEIRLDKAYSFDPIPSDLSDEEAKHILGPQANLWTERIPNFKHVEYMIFPRLLALSEVAWGTSNPFNYQDFVDRVVKHFDYFDQNGINYSKAIFEVTGKSEIIEGKEYFVMTIPADVNHTIHYTTDGSIPSSKSMKYMEPIEIKESITIKAANFDNEKQISSVLTQRFLISKSTGKSIQLVNDASRPYVAHGSGTLVDGIFGNPQSFKNNWLGFNANDLDATIDLNEITTISSVALNCVDATESWIHLPVSVKVYLSLDGEKYNEVKTVNLEEIKQSKGKLILNFPSQKTKFIRILVQNTGKIPEGYPGAGYDAWLFVDEIMID